MSDIIKLGDPSPKSRRDRMQRQPTTAEVMEWIHAGVTAGAKNVFDQLSEAQAQMFAQLEEMAVQRVLREMEARSWRGRLRQRLRTWRARLKLEPPPSTVTFSRQAGTEPEEPR